MTLIKRPFTENDYLAVRDFLIQSYKDNFSQHNWLIDRWNFCRHVPQIMMKTYDSWPHTVGLWVDERDNIAAVVNSEGEKKGEAFFQLAPLEFTPELYHNFLDHAEEHLYSEKELKRSLHLRVNPRDKVLKKIIGDRGYEFKGRKEPASVLKLNSPFEIKIPRGFSIQTTENIQPTKIGIAHAKAFGYYRNEGVNERSAAEAYDFIRKAPDYRTEQDLLILDQENEIACFATFWYDQSNQIASIEPLGTLPQYRRKGLARALVYSAANHFYELGVRKLYVGSDQKFYVAIGFRIEYASEIWQKEW